MYVTLSNVPPSPSRNPPIPVPSLSIPSDPLRIIPQQIIQHLIPMHHTSARRPSIPLRSRGRRRSSRRSMASQSGQCSPVMLPSMRSTRIRVSRRRSRSQRPVPRGRGSRWAGRACAVAAPSGLLMMVVGCASGGGVLGVLLLLVRLLEVMVLLGLLVMGLAVLLLGLGHVAAVGLLLRLLALLGVEAGGAAGLGLGSWAHAETLEGLEMLGCGGEVVGSGDAHCGLSGVVAARAPSLLRGWGSCPPLACVGRGSGQVGLSHAMRGWCRRVGSRRRC